MGINMDNKLMDAKAMAWINDHIVTDNPFDNAHMVLAYRAGWIESRKQTIEEVLALMWGFKQSSIYGEIKQLADHGKE